MTDQEPAAYDISSIVVLEGLEAVRKRPGMYVGSTGTRGLHVLAFQVAGWGFDEILRGRASRVELTLLRDGGVRVAVDGFGVDRDGLATALSVLTMGCGSFGRRFPVRLGQLSVVNALSSRLVTEPAGGRVTAITFWPDPEIFETVEFSFEALAEHFRELAFLYRELDVSLTDERDQSSLRFHFPGGVREMVAFVAGQNPDIVGFEREEPQMAGLMEIAWCWRGSAAGRVRSYANGQRTPEGGTHELGFRDGVSAALTAYARERRLLASTDPDIASDAIGAGLAAVVSVKVDHPEFGGCTRGRLDNAEVRGYVRQAVQEHLGGRLAEHPNQASEILGRIVRGRRREPLPVRVASEAGLLAD